MANMDNPSHGEQQANKSIAGELSKLFSALDLQIKKQPKEIAQVLTEFKNRCSVNLDRLIGAATASSRPQRLAALMVNHSITEGREEIITDTVAVLQSLFDTTSIKVGEDEYKLNQFMIATVNRGGEYQDSTISVDFILPGAIRDQLSKLATPATAGVQTGGEPSINRPPVSQAESAEAVVSSPDGAVGVSETKNVAFARMLPRLLNGIDAELARLITAAAQRTPGNGNIYVELPDGTDIKAVVADLFQRIGRLAYPQRCKVPGHGANAIQITVNNLSQ